jgi:hypothetical protein
VSAIAADVALFESVHISFCLINAKCYCLNSGQWIPLIRVLLICGFLWVLSALNFLAFSAHPREIYYLSLPFTLFLGALSFTLLNVFAQKSFIV